MFWFRKKTKHSRLSVELAVVTGEISRSKRYGYQFGILSVEVPHSVPRGLSKLLPGKTISFHVMEKHIRQYDTIIRSILRRYFIVLPQADKKGVKVVIDRIKNLADEYGWGSIVISSAVYPDDGDSASVLLEKAVSGTDSEG